MNKIRHEVRIAAPIERVWAVVTDAEHVGKWFGNGEPAKIDLRPGGMMYFDHGKHGILPAKIDRIDPHTYFSYRWTSEGKPEVVPDETNSTLVEFALHADGAGTLLVVTESGFDQLTIPVEQRRARFNANDPGWAQMVATIEKYTAGL